MYSLSASHKGLKLRQFGDENLVPNINVMIFYHANFVRYTELLQQNTSADGNNLTIVTPNRLQQIFTARTSQICTRETDLRAILERPTVKMAKSLLEVACFNLESAEDAILTGAQRIEWCYDRDVGGLTPKDPHDVQRLRELQGPYGCIPVYVMIRSNSDPTFTASEADVSCMKDAIGMFKPYASGFVFGLLRANGMIDAETCQKLVDIAYPLPCTFHRAFDYARHELGEKFSIVRRCGFASILSSGGPHDAILGKDVLKQLVGLARGQMFR